MAAAPPLLPDRFANWFAGRGWQARSHQLEMVARAKAGRDALLIAPTGGGKTLAGFLPSLIELAERPPANTPQGIHTLYISPLKALAVDVERNLMAPILQMGLPIVAESRTGDTGVSRNQRQRVKPPDILLTTPEQLALFCAWEGARLYFENLSCVIIDEIHAIHASKRGDLLALALARLQVFAPDMRRVGLSATVDDPDVIRRWMAWGGRTTAETPRPEDTVDLVFGPPAPSPWWTCCCRRGGCPGPATPPSTPWKRSIRRSRGPGPPWSSSTPVSRPSSPSRNSGGSMMMTCPSPCITGPCQLSRGARSKQPWPGGTEGCGLHLDPGPGH